MSSYGLIRQRDYFVYFSSFLRPWLRELVDAYKERGIYPHGVWDLLRYYSKPEDVEAAGYVTLGMNWDARTTDAVSEMRSLIGAHPGVWFRDRGFIGAQMSRPGFSKTAAILDAIWTARRNGMRDEFVLARKIGRMTEDRIIALKAVFGTSDGIGVGLRTVMPPLPRCPILEPVKRFVAIWYWDSGRPHMPWHDKVRMFGMKRDSDLLLAAWAWNEICIKQQGVCRHYMDTYQRRFANGDDPVTKRSTVLRDGLPRIEF